VNADAGKQKPFVPDRPKKTQRMRMPAKPGLKRLQRKKKKPEKEKGKSHEEKAGQKGRNKQEQQRSAYFRYLRGDDRRKQNIAEMNNDKTGRCWQNGSIRTTSLLN